VSEERDSTSKGRPDDHDSGALTVRYDFRADELVVGGIRYAGELFRQFQLAPVGAILEIVERWDGVITVRRLEPVDEIRLKTDK
jgi:hypothetical protein